MLRLKRTSCMLAALLLASAVHAQQVKTVNISIGTGFFVNDEGYLLTNHHVIKKCKRYSVYSVDSSMQAELVDADEKNDLALLKTPFAAAEIGVFREREEVLEPGDAVQVVGFPGAAWKKHKPVVRTAQLLDTKGPRGEESLMQFSDSVALGNSGGPLLDGAGNVMGVIVAKSTLMRINTLTHETESVRHADVAINAPTVWNFLEQNSVRYRMAKNNAPLTQDQITKKATRFVVNVRCVVEP